MVDNTLENYDTDCVLRKIGKDEVDADYIEGYKDGSDMFFLAVDKYYRLGGHDRFPIRKLIVGKCKKGLWCIKTYIEARINYKREKPQNYSLGYFNALMDMNKTREINVDIWGMILTATKIYE